MQMITLGTSGPWAEGEAGAEDGDGAGTAAAGPASGRGQMVMVVVVQQQQAVAGGTEGSREAAGGRQEGADGRASNCACISKCCQHGACNTILQFHLG